MGISKELDSSYESQKNKNLVKTRVEKILNKISTYKGEYILFNKDNFDENKIIIQHTACGETITTSVDFLLKRKKIYCFTCETKHRTEKFKEKLSEKYSNYDEYEVLGEYIDFRVPILMKHKTCGYTYKIQPKSISNRGLNCALCSNAVKKTTQIFKSEVFNLTKGKYLVLGEYTDSNTKILMKSVKCNHVFHIMPWQFIKNPNCPVCAEKEKAKQKHLGLVKKFNEKYKGEYEILTQIYNVTGVIDVLHKHCGKIVKTSYVNMMYGGTKMPCTRCRKIRNNNNLEKRKNDFFERAYKKWGDEYEYIGEYKSQKKPILTRHKQCGCEFYTLPRRILNCKNICPTCDKAKEIMNTKERSL